MFWLGIFQIIANGGRPRGTIVKKLGGARWKAPEYFPGPGFKGLQIRPGDVWAYGLLVYEILVHGAHLPYTILSAQSVSPIFYRKVVFILTETYAIFPLYRLEKPSFKAGLHLTTMILRKREFRRTWSSCSRLVGSSVSQSVLLSPTL
jgi:hypothetical protein